MQSTPDMVGSKFMTPPTGVTNAIGTRHRVVGLTKSINLVSPVQLAPDMAGHLVGLKFITSLTSVTNVIGTRLGTGIEIIIMPPVSEDE